MDDKLDAQLAELRDGIDRIDERILGLLTERAGLARRVGELKHTSGWSYHVPERERAVVERLKEIARELNFPEGAVAPIFREVMSACLRLESPISVAYLGPGSTFSYLALRKVFGDSAQVIAEPTLDDVFDCIENDRADYAVVPIENSFEGTVHESMQRLIRTRMLVHGEYYLPIEHNLLSRAKSLSQIKTIISHPQAFLQCRAWLRSHLPAAELVPSTSTSQACIEALESDASAAIASISAAAEAGIDVLVRNIHDRGNNETRFLILTREAKLVPRPTDKTSLIFSVNHLSGRLYQVLEVFGAENVNILKLESVPDRNKPWKAHFWMDCEAILPKDKRDQIFAHARRHCDAFNHIGTYSRLE